MSAEHTIIVWRRLDLPGHEWARLTSLDDGWQLDGAAVFVHDRRPCHLSYTIICSAGWQTEEALIWGAVGDHDVRLDVGVDELRRWHLNGVECPEVAGCVDVDLGFSPSTNLLPIRRLALAVGDEAEVRAAWLPFPSLEFKVLPQRYIRESENGYRYESSGGAFVRRLQVNSVGLVTEYPGIWVEEDRGTMP